MNKRARTWALCGLAALMVVSLGVTPAAANSVHSKWKFSFDIDTSPITPVHSVLVIDTTNPLPGGFYLITSLTGTQAGDAITLAAPNTFRNNDNQFNPNGNLSGTPPWVTMNGFAYSLSNGEKYDLFWNGSGYVGCWGSVCRSVSNLKISAVPEPASLLLLGTGALGLAGNLRRKLRT